MNNRSRNIFVYILIFAAIAAIVFGVRNNSANSKEITISRLVADINDGKVKAVEVSDEGKLTATYEDGDETRKAQINANNDNPVELLKSLGADEQKLDVINF